MPFDYKKEYKEFYLPKNQPSIVKIPEMNYLAVRGQGDPNIENGEYKQSIGLLYAIAFTIKMSKKGDHRIKGYFDYVVPPLEGFWWQDSPSSQNGSNSRCIPDLQNSSNPQNGGLIDYSRKTDLNFISLIRLPEFVTQADFDWAISEAARKKHQDFSKVEFLTYDEGICVQCMHLGSYDTEPETVELMHQYIAEQGYQLDINNPRYHHEIYLSDPRRCQADKLKTVLRHPIKML